MSSVVGGPKNLPGTCCLVEGMCDHYKHTATLEGLLCQT